MATAYWSYILTHSCLLKGEEPPVCIPCYEVLSVEHIFTDCVDLKGYRNWLGFFVCLFVCLFCFVLFLTFVLKGCCSVSILRAILLNF